MKKLIVSLVILLAANPTFAGGDGGHQIDGMNQQTDADATAVINFGSCLGGDCGNETVVPTPALPGYATPNLTSPYLYKQANNALPLAGTRITRTTTAFFGSARKIFTETTSFTVESSPYEMHFIPWQESRNPTTTPSITHCSDPWDLGICNDVQPTNDSSENHRVFFNPTGIEVKNFLVWGIGSVKCTEDSGACLNTMGMAQQTAMNMVPNRYRDIYVIGFDSGNMGVEGVSTNSGFNISLGHILFPNNPMSAGISGGPRGQDGTTMPKLGYAGITYAIIVEDNKNGIPVDLTSYMEMVFQKKMARKGNGNGAHIPDEQGGIQHLNGNKPEKRAADKPALATKAEPKKTYPRLQDVQWISTEIECPDCK